MNLEKKTAIVTGGAVRIGQAIAIALADAGINIVLHYGHSETAAQETAAVINNLGGHITIVQADLQKPVAAAKSIMEHALNHFGAVDILINNAAIFEKGNLRTTSEEEWDRYFAINLKAPVFLSQAFAEALKKEQVAHIINIVDWRATKPDVDYLAYSLTKSGLVTMTQTLAKELAPYVQVNAIAPGAILPPPGNEDAYSQRISQQIPLQRCGNRDEITDGVLYLLRSNFVTGEVLYITGGEQL
ncbi:FolM Alternative dihydrofolate reductase 1 [hydrothermal vent metagenome]|uniref:FolM Alternative dihydrofolate reductase 1 n=1 Tax=hydrothermal vent metagenome TaxID=652676 RepID=A0A3B1DDI9_9ZZZZ